MADKHYVDTVGLVIYVATDIDLSSATNTKLLVQKPSGEEVEWSATAVVDEFGETTRLKYTTVSGDLDEEGFYKLQASATISGWTGKGRTTSFKVYAKFK